MSIITRPQNADYDAGYERTFTSKTVDPVCRGCGQKRWSVSYDHGYRTLTCKRCQLVCVEVQTTRPGVYEFKDQYPLGFVPLPLGAELKLCGQYRPPLDPQQLEARLGGGAEQPREVEQPAEQPREEVKTLRFTRLPPGPQPKPGPTVQLVCGGCGELEDRCRCYFCHICTASPCECHLRALPESP